MASDAGCAFAGDLVIAVEVAGAVEAEEVAGASVVADGRAAAVAGGAPTGSEVRGTGEGTGARKVEGAGPEFGAAELGAGSVSDPTESDAPGEEFWRLIGSTDSAGSGQAAEAKEVSGMTGGAVAGDAIGEVEAVPVIAAVVGCELDCGDAGTAVEAAVAVERSGAGDAVCANPGSGRIGIGGDAELSEAFDRAGMSEVAGAVEVVGATETAGAKRSLTKEVKVANGLAGAGDSATEDEASSEVVAVAAEVIGASEATDENGMVAANDKEPA